MPAVTQVPAIGAAREGERGGIVAIEFNFRQEFAEALVRGVPRSAAIASSS